jgi:PEP-CTERM motif
MRRKNLHCIMAASGVVLGLGLNSARATPEVQLSLTMDFNGNWTAYAQTDSGTDNAGLATFAIDVIGSGGFDVTSSNVGAPMEGGTGFSQGYSGGDDGIAITAGQQVAYSGVNSPRQDADVIQGYGQPGATSYTNSFTGATFNWSVPSEIAYGTYSVSSLGGPGGLTVQADTSIGLGIQTLNDVSNGKWLGPTNITFDTVIPQTQTRIEVGPIVSLNLVPIDAPGIAPPQYDVAAAGASTVTPASADTSDNVAFSGAPVEIHVNAPQTDEGFRYKTDPPFEPVNMLIRFVDTATGTDPATGSVLTDIENYINSNSFANEFGLTVSSSIPSSFSSQFPGTTFDLMLSSPIVTGPFAYLDFSGFSDSAVPLGDLAVSDIGIVPEPGSIGILALSAVGLLARKRKNFSHR